MSITLPQTAAAPAVDAHANPFKGPFPLGFGDPIFGRDQEIRDLLSMLIPRRLVLLHAVSGCGKTSLLEAGVRERLPLRRLRGLPTIRFAGAGSVPSHGRNPLTAAAIGSLGGTPAAEAGTLDAGLTRLVEAMPRASDDKRSFACLIFDQFEEALTNTSVSEQDRVAFFKELGLALDYPDRWAIFAIRDDYLGALEPYLRYLPTQLSARMRLTQLAEAQACDAIAKLCEPSAVRFTPAGATRMARELATHEGAVEPVYLQVACRYLWSKSHDAGQREIGPADVILQEQARASGDEHAMADATPVERALADYYDEGVQAVAGHSDAAQQQLRNWFGTELIVLTSRGEWRRQTLWTDSSKVTRSELHALQNRYLVRIDDRQGIWVELAHDRLVAPILASNRFWLRKFKQPWQEAAEKWHTAGRDQALLLVDEPALAEAQTWAAAHPEWIGPYEREFLDHSRTFVNTRRAFRRGTRVWVIVAAAMTLIAGGAALLAWYRTLSAAEAIDAAGRLVQHAREEVGAAREEEVAARGRAQMVEEAAARTKDEADRAINDANEVVNNARKTRDDAIRRSERAERDRLKAEKDAKEAQATEQRATATAANAREEGIHLQQEATALKAASQAYKLTAASRRLRRLGESITALRELVTTWPAETTSQQRDALLGTLTTVRELLSRGLLVEQRCTWGFVQSLAIARGANDAASALRYINQDGRLHTTFAPCSPDEGTAANGAVTDAVGAAPDAAAAAAAGGDDGSSDFRFPTASSFGGEGTRSVVGTALGRVQVADAAGKPRTPFYDHKHEIAALSLSPSGRYLIASSAMWSFSVRDLGEWPENKSKPKRVYRLPASGLRGWIQWLKTAFGETTQVVKSFAVFEEPAPASAAAADGLVAVGRQDAAIEVYRLRKPELVMRVSGPFGAKISAGGKRFVGHVKPVLALAFDRSGERLASGGQDGAIFVWTIPRDGVAGAAPTSSFSVGTCGGSTESLVFSPHESILAAGCQDGTILLFAVKRDGTGATRLVTLRGNVGEVRHLLFDPVRKRLFAGGSDTRIEEWYLPDANEVSFRCDLTARLQRLEEAIRHPPGDSADARPLPARVQTLLENLDQLHLLHSPDADDRWTR